MGPRNKCGDDKVGELGHLTEQACQCAAQGLSNALLSTGCRVEAAERGSSLQLAEPDPDHAGGGIDGGFS